jgi:hypothetical protein
MITKRNLLAKGSIEVTDAICFTTHAEVLKLFGKTYKSYQGAFLKHPHEEGVHIWFPKINTTPLPDDEWMNSKTADWKTVFEKKMDGNETYLADLREDPARQTRILFAKVPRNGKDVYEFKGVYKFDSELSTKARKAAYTRIATTAKLYPEG